VVAPPLGGCWFARSDSQKRPSGNGGRFVRSPGAGRNPHKKAGDQVDPQEVQRTEFVTAIAQIHRIAGLRLADLT